MISLTSPLRQPNSEALNLSQQASRFHQKHASTGTSTVPIPFLSYSESTELWVSYEKLLLSCLRTGDDKAAHLCLEKLIDRFGATNERVMGLRGLYQEAVAEDDAGLGRILKEYNEVLAEDAANAPVAKRRIALLRSLCHNSEAIGALTELLESSPTDIEAWTELSDLYLSLKLFAQAIFCLEEVLLVVPNAWNIHARLGEVLYISAGDGAENFDARTVAESMRRFCRSIELCDDYLRGYYGLKMATDRLLTNYSKDNKTNSWQVTVPDNGGIPVPTIEAVRRLNEQATSKLTGMTRKGTGKGYDYAELVAARALLDRSTQARR